MVDLIEILTTTALHDHWLVDVLAVAIARPDCIGFVKFKNDCFPVIYIDSDVAACLAENSPVEWIIAVDGKGAVRHVYTDQPVPHVPGINPRWTRAGACYLLRSRRQVSVRVVGVAEGVILEQLIGGVVNMGGGQVRGDAVALFVVAVAFRRRGETAGGYLLGGVVGEVAGTARLRDRLDEAVVIISVVETC